MTELTDPETVIRHAQPGMMIFGRVIFEPDKGWETALFIRETPGYVNRLGKNPVIELRAGVFAESGVTLVALLMGIGRGLYLYETWFNYQAAQFSFSDLATQERIAIAFYMPVKARQIAIKNSLRAFFRQAQAQAKEARRWSMKEFDAAREQVYAEYPDVVDLWDAIRGG